MQVYLASPNTQQQAEHCAEMNVLMSFACFSTWLWRYQTNFKRILIDSGAYSELNSGKKIDIEAYKEWSHKWRGRAEAIAGLDDISGDYRRSLKNYAAIEWSFPTWHDSDPIELIDELAAMAKERKTWLGIGMMPPRHGKERIIREALDRVPDGIHVHGWALRLYQYIGRIDSVDSTNWWRDAMALNKTLSWLHYGECLDLIIKRYQREQRTIYAAPEGLFQ